MKIAFLFLLFVAFVSADSNFHIITCISDKEGSDLKMDNIVVTNDLYSYKVKWIQTLKPWQNNPIIRISNICGKNVPWKGFLTKPTQILKYLENVSPNDLVMFTDGTDVLFNIVGVPHNEIIKRFKSSNAPILTMAEPWCWLSHACTRQEMELYYPDTMTKESDCPRFLNSGSYIGYAFAIQFMLKEQIRMNNQIPFDDQGTMAMVRHEYPWLISLDEKQDIFSTITSANISLVARGMPACSGYVENCGFNSNLDEEWTKDIRKRKTDACDLRHDPLVIHANGPTGKFLSQFQKMLEHAKLYKKYDANVSKSQYVNSVKRHVVKDSVTIHGETFQYFGGVPDAEWISVVLTMPSATERRNWIRSTSSIPVMFLIGYESKEDLTEMSKQCRDEFDKYQDLLYIGVAEQYGGDNNSPLRKMWSAAHAILHHAPSVRFIQKRDHDTWVEFPVVKAEVESMKSPIYYGKVLKNHKKEAKGHKNYISQHKGDILPDFCSGWMYVFDRTFIESAFALPETDLPYLGYFEDVFFGVIAETLGVKAIHGSYLLRSDIPINEKGVPKHMHYWYHGHWGPTLDGSKAGVRYFGEINRGAKQLRIHSKKVRDRIRGQAEKTTFILVSSDEDTKTFYRYIDENHEELIEHRDMLLVSRYDKNIIQQLGK